MTTYRMYKDHERELGVPLAMAVLYQAGDRGKHGEVVRGYVACELSDRTPKQIERLYYNRSAIETSYQLVRQARATTTTTKDPLVRFAFMLVSFPLENLWLVLRWAVVARPRRGGRDLPEPFTFTTFCDWIRHALEEALARLGVPPGYATVGSPSMSGCYLRYPHGFLSSVLHLGL